MKPATRLKITYLITAEGGVQGTHVDPDDVAETSDELVLTWYDEDEITFKEEVTYFRNRLVVVQKRTRRVEVKEEDPVMKRRAE